MKDEYINIKEIAQAKGLKSTRLIRMEINKPESKYISREVKVNGGTSYEFYLYIILVVCVCIEQESFDEKTDNINL